MNEEVKYAIKMRCEAIQKSLKTKPTSLFNYECWVEKRKRQKRAETPINKGFEAETLIADNF